MVMLLVIFVQDLRMRMISGILLPLLLAGLVTRMFVAPGFSIYQALFNLAFLAAQFALLTLFYILRRGSASGLIDTHIGLGDLLLLPVLCFAFSPLNFLVFYVSALLVTLLCFLGWKRLSGKPVTTIPLAGGISAYLILVIMTGLASHFDRYNDDFLLTLFRYS
jgi:hypothetical protein